MSRNSHDIQAAIKFVNELASVAPLAGTDEGIYLSIVAAELDRRQQAIAQLEEELVKSRRLFELRDEELEEVKVTLSKSRDTRATLARYSGRLEDELVKYFEMDVRSNCIQHEDGWVSIPPDGYSTSARNAVSGLVGLRRWEKHPDRAGLYRSIPKESNDV